MNRPRHLPALLVPLLLAACAGDDKDGTGDDTGSGQAVIWYRDYDGDGYGNIERTIEASKQPVDYVADATDCDDGDAHVNPGAAELCDPGDTDEDCDGLADDEDDSVDSSTYTLVYADADNDGYGDASQSSTSCDPPEGSVNDDTDCDDTDATVWPEAPEICFDEQVNACEGDIDSAREYCRRNGTRAEDGADLRFSAGEAGDGLGSAIIGTDLNQDGFTDLIITGGATEGGVVYVYRGRASAWSSLADTEMSADSAAPGLGASMAELDDIDGDGASDLAFGATAAGSAGTVYVLIGHEPAYSKVSTQSQATIIGDAGAMLGAAVGSAGDLNGDGEIDLLVGAPGDAADLGDGMAAMIFGPLDGEMVPTDSAAVVIGENSGDALGSAVGSPGDLDGDGLPDAVFTAPGARALYVFSAPAEGVYLASDADTVLTGPAATALSGADLDGDGHADLLVGAPEDEGAVYGLFGPLSSASSFASADLILSGGADGDAAGTSLSTGDLDNDGLVDLVVGAPGYVGTGAAFLFFGPVAGSGSMADASFTQGGSAASEAGAAVAVLGDINGDGFDDFATGGPNADSAGPAGGFVWMNYGSGI